MSGTVIYCAVSSSIFGEIKSFQGNNGSDCSDHGCGGSDGGKGAMVVLML